MPKVYVRLLSRRELGTEWKRRNSFGIHVGGSREAVAAVQAARDRMDAWQRQEPYTEFQVEVSAEAW